MSEWQPIETAPKDGTHIIAEFEDGAIEAWYLPALNRWEVAVLDSHGCGCCGCDNLPPTRWMPLPPA